MYKIPPAKYDIEKSMLSMTAREKFWVQQQKVHLNLALLCDVLAGGHGMAIGDIRTFEDGKHYVKAKRASSRELSLLDCGYYSALEERTAQKCKYRYVTLQATRHAKLRHEKRAFDLSPIKLLYGYLSQAKCNQHVLVNDGETVMVAVRSRDNGAKLITGYLSGDIDWDDYLDKKF
jgi:hypothetical protein